MSMKAIRINFAPHSLLRTARETHPITWLLAAAGAALCAGAIVTGSALLQDYQSRTLDLQRKQASLTERGARKPAPKKSNATEAQATAVNNAIAQLNLPWRDLLDAVEAATPANIALLTLAPDAKKHVVKGSAEAKSSDAMIDYIEQLKQQDFFSAVVLTKHEINEQDPNRPIRFQFEAQWAEANQ